MRDYVAVQNFDYHAIRGFCATYDAKLPERFVHSITFWVLQTNYTKAAALWLTLITSRDAV